MKVTKTLVAAAALVASVGATANAQVVGSLGGGTATFYSLSGPAACTLLNPCTLGPGIGTIVGGSTFQVDQPFADIPKGVILDNRFLASGPTSGTPATLTFLSPVGYVSFLWGSPDLHNVLTVNSTTGTQQFTVSSLGFSVTNGNQAFSQYVQFQAGAGTQITSLVFENNPQVNAFEAANFSTVPEPSTYVLMATGLAALAFASKRRKQA